MPPKPTKFQIDCPLILRALWLRAGSIPQWRQSSPQSTLCYIIQLLVSSSGRVTLSLVFLLFSYLPPFRPSLFSTASHVWECVLSKFDDVFVRFDLSVLSYCTTTCCRTQAYLLDLCSCHFQHTCNMRRYIHISHASTLLIASLLRPNVLVSAPCIAVHSIQVLLPVFSKAFHTQNQHRIVGTKRNKFIRNDVIV